MIPSLLEVFFYYNENLERENAIPIDLVETTENIEFLIRFLEKVAK